MKKLEKRQRKTKQHSILSDRSLVVDPLVIGLVDLSFGPFVLLFWGREQMSLDDAALLLLGYCGHCRHRRNKNQGGLARGCDQWLLLLLLNRHEPLELKLLLLLKQLLLLQKLLLLKLLLLLLDLQRGKYLLLLLLKLELLLLLLPLLLKLELELKLMLELLLLHDSGGGGELALTKLKQGIADPLELIHLDIQLKLGREEKLELELVQFWQAQATNLSRETGRGWVRNKERKNLWNIGQLGNERKTETIHRELCRTASFQIQIDQMEVLGGLQGGFFSLPWRNVHWNRRGQM